jgi:hypothetical protein
MNSQKKDSSNVLSAERRESRTNGVREQANEPKAELNEQAKQAKVKPTEEANGLHKTTSLQRVRVDYSPKNVSMRDLALNEVINVYLNS